jgi:hypothetical protein
MKDKKEGALRRRNAKPRTGLLGIRSGRRAKSELQEVLLQKNRA